MTIATVFQGSLFTAATPTQLTYLADALVCLDETGIIDRVLPTTATDYAATRQAAARTDRLIQLPPDHYLLPGFIDLHVHAPQWPQAGLALDRPLHEWLTHYTFPLEARYRDSAFARPVYADLVRTLLTNGTTTALYFGTIHRTANLILAQQCARWGQRGYIGQVVMDNPDQTPSTYRDPSAQAAIAGTERFIHDLQSYAQQTGAALTPVITPRFVPSCTANALAGLGQLARQYDLPVQSHCSESRWEDQYVQNRFHDRDAAVLARFGLLTNRAVMAHGTQLTAADLTRFHDCQATVAHCPISNAYFGNTIFPTRQALDAGVTVGLGTDLSGGFTPSLYRNLQQAVMVSQLRADDLTLSPSSTTSQARISATTAFYLATRGGASALHLNAGILEPGNVGDLQVVYDRPVPGRPRDAQAVFERLMYHTTPAEIRTVYVGGRRVVGAVSPESTH